MEARQRAGLRERLADPVQRRRLTWAALAVLAWLALLLRWTIDAGGVVDVDVVNFGLAAIHFDVLDHQPQPPGYPGYVLYLKLLHAIAPALGPIELAKWGARVCGLLTVPAAYWACRELLAGEDALGRPLVSAALAAVHPVLWYYGTDGQAHGAEALVSLCLFAITVRARRRRTIARLLVVVAAFGLAGSLRPTIAALGSPLLVWLFWGRPARDWLLAVLVGVAVVAAWAAPTVVLTGGWDLYRRASRALVGELFVSHFSLFGSQARAPLVVGNIVKTLWWSAIALLPVLSACPFGGRAWRRVWLALVVLAILFYALVYAAEAGYLAGVAALACLAPATWPPAPRRSLRLRAAAVLVACPLFFLAGPAGAPVPDHPPAELPTLAHALDVQASQDIYQRAVCAAAAGRPAILLEDNPSMILSRRVPIRCPNIAIALYVSAMPFDPDRVIDAWMIFFPDGIQAIPTGVPLEPGPPTHAQLPHPVERVIVAPDATSAFATAMLAPSTCAPGRYVDPGSGLELLTVPAACLPTLRTPTHTIDLTAPPRAGAPPFGGL